MIVPSVVFMVLAASWSGGAQPGGPGAGRDAAPVAAPGPVETYTGRSVLRVETRTPAELMAVMALAEDVWTHTPRVGPLDVMVTPDRAGAVRAYAAARGLPVEVMIPDVASAVREERARIERSNLARGLGWYEDFKDLTQVYAKVDELVAAHPAMASQAVIGQGHEGRPIRVLRISAPDSPENPRAGRRQVIFTGTQHAREWVSPMTVMYIAETLLNAYGSDPDVRAAMDSIEFLIVPVVNPDGYTFSWTNQRMWRKNRRNNGNGSFGVDTNRNFPYQWGGEGASGNTGNDTYRGPSAGSEPETQAVMALANAAPRLDAHIDFHSYSQLILSPWGYTSSLPPDAALFDDLNARMASAILATWGQTYVGGPSYTTIYPASGVMPDWMYGARGALSWTIELRDTGQFGFILPADQILPCAQENFNAVMELAGFVQSPVSISFPGGIPSERPAGAPASFGVTVSAWNDTVASAALWYRRAGEAAFVSAPLESLGGTAYRATLPASSCGVVTEFYIEASGVSGRSGRAPAGAPGVFFASSAADRVVVFADACEGVNGWAVGAPGDAATTGLWSNDVPQATAAQPGNQVTPGGARCWITDGRAGAGVGTYDVDGGATTLTSPRFSALGPSGWINPRVTLAYWRWYSNDRGSNPNTNSMPVLISNDDGATWSPVELVAENAGRWVEKRWDLAGVGGGGVVPTDRMRLRFVARDLTGAIVEAAVDEVSVAVTGCPPNPADFNGDGFIDFFDLDAFIECFEGGACPEGKTADFNGDGFIDFFDLDAFVEAFENG